MLKKKYLIFITVTVLLLTFFPIKILIDFNLEEKKQIRRLVNELSHKDNAIKANAIESLDKIGASALSVLIRALKEKDDSVKINIIQLLGKFQNNKAINPLFETLKSNNWRVRFFSAKALSQIRDKKSTDHLLQAWQKEKWWQVKREIAIAISKINDKKALSVFLEAYNNSEDIKTKIFSTLVLYKLSDDKCYFDVLKDLIHNQDYQVRFITIWTLGELVGELEDKGSFLLLQEALNDKDPKIQKETQRIINKKGNFKK